MANLPKKVTERLSKQIVLFQRILADAKKRDINESDTVTIVTDMLAGMFGFDKYSEVTSEQAIRGTYCDLAVTIDGTVRYLIEVKAIGLTLKDNHLRQAINYGANHGIPWIVLTNGIVWDIYRIKFERPIVCEQTCSIDLSALSPRKADDLAKLFLLCKEGLAKDAIDAFHEHAQIVNRYTIAAILNSEPVLSLVRREIRRIAPTAKVNIGEIAALMPDVLKRDAIEGESAAHAKRRVTRSLGKQLRTKQAKVDDSGAGEVITEEALVPPCELGGTA